MKISKITIISLGLNLIISLTNNKLMASTSVTIVNKTNGTLSGTIKTVNVPVRIISGVKGPDFSVSIPMGGENTYQLGACPAGEDGFAPCAFSSFYLSSPGLACNWTPNEIQTGNIRLYVTPGRAGRLNVSVNGSQDVCG